MASDDTDEEHFLTSLEGKSGVYFISPIYDPSDPQKRVLAKVGMSQNKVDGQERRYGGLGKRLDSYLLCWPFGFHLYAVLQTKAQHAFEMERFFQSYYARKGYQTQYRHSRTEEWFFLLPDDVKTAVAAALRSPEYAGKICKPTVYEEPVFIDSNGRRSNRVKPMTTDEKTSLEQFMSPRAVPRTLRKGKRRKATHPSLLSPIPRYYQGGSEDDEDVDDA
jgi:hypothetical protein